MKFLTLLLTDRRYFQGFVTSDIYDICLYITQLSTFAFIKSLFVCKLNNKITFPVSDKYPLKGLEKTPGSLKDLLQYPFK